MMIFDYYENDDDHPQNFNYKTKNNYAELLLYFDFLSMSSCF